MDNWCCQSGYLAPPSFCCVAIHMEAMAWGIHMSSDYPEHKRATHSSYSNSGLLCFFVRTVQRDVMLPRSGSGI